MDTVLITGGTGLVGKALTQLLLDRGYKVIILSRQLPKTDNPRLSYAQWDITRKTIDLTAIQQADFIVHLAGANVAEKRWSPARKKEILDSRTQTSHLLFDTLRQHPNKVKKIISASATGYYGTYTDKTFIENDTPAEDFLGSTCAAWENSVLQMGTLGKQVVIFRTGIALSRDGGALKEFYKPLKLGFATILGGGEQWISWIHIQDLVRLYFNAIVNDHLNGIYNAVAPQPVPHKELVMTMARAAKGKSFITTYVPAFALKLALGEMSEEVLKSMKVSSQKIQNTGFVFSYPTIQQAMEQLFKK